MVGKSGAINISEVAEIGGSAATTGAGASAFEPRRRVFLVGAAASTTDSTEAGVLAVALGALFAGALVAARREAGFSTSRVAADLAGAFLAGALTAALAGVFATAFTAGSAAVFDAALLTGFFESVTGAFVSFLITISGALQAACVWATLTSC